MSRKLSIYATAALYIGAGVAHFAWPGGYARIVPRWVPDAEAAVFWSGVAEVLLGVGVLRKRTRYAASLGIILLLIAVFPANVEMARDWWRTNHPHKWVALLRLPIQPLLMWWAWKVRKG